MQRQKNRNMRDDKPLNNREKKTRRESDRMVSQKGRPVRGNGHVDVQPSEEDRHSSQFRVELQVEMENNRLHKELEKLKVSHQDDIQRYQIETYGLGQLVDCLHWELEQAEKEIKEKDDLVADSEKLQKRLEQSQQHLECVLQVETDKNKALREEVEELKVLYNKDHVKYETELINAEQLVETLQQELQQENQQMALLHKQYEELQERLQRSQESFTAELQVEREKLRLLQENQHKALLQEEQEELQETSATEPRKEAEVSEEMPCLQQETIQEEAKVSEEELPEIQVEAEVSEEELPETNKKPSFWKRARHFLGLRKPQKWKKEKKKE